MLHDADGVNQAKECVFLVGMVRMGSSSEVQVSFLFPSSARISLAGVSQFEDEEIGKILVDFDALAQTSQVSMTFLPHA